MQLRRGGGITLAASTEYFLVLKVSGTRTDHYTTWRNTEEDSEDASGLNDWTVDNEHIFRLHSGTNTDWQDNIQQSSLKFRINGEVLSTPGITVEPPTDKELTEGDASDVTTFTAVLDSAPSSDVTVTVTAAAGLELDGPDSSADFTVSEALSFTASNWNMAQTVRVRAADDNTDSPSGRQLSVTYTTSSSDSVYNGLPAGTAATVTVIDNDATTVTLAGSAADVEEGSAKTFTVTLNRGLVAGETLSVPLVFGGGATRGTDYSTVCPTTLPKGVTCGNLDSGGNPSVTFTGPAAGQTDTSVMLTLSAASDSTVESEGETVDINLGALNTNSGTGLDGGARGADNLAVFSIIELAGITLSSPADTTVKEGDPADKTSFTVKLDRQPMHAVTVTVTATDGLELDGPDSGATFTASAPLSFSTSNWNMTQTVSVRALGDDTDSPSGRKLSVTYAVSSSDSAYDNLPGGTAATVTVIDNDPTSVTLARIGTGAIDEGGTAMMTVTLSRDLIAHEIVTVPLSVSGADISAGDYMLELSTGMSLNTGVTLLTGAPHSAAQPAVMFTGGSAMEQTARLTLIAVDDSEGEAAETLTVSLGSKSRAIISNLDQISTDTQGTGGTTSAEASVQIEINLSDGGIPPVISIRLPDVEGTSERDSIEVYGEDAQMVAFNIIATPSPAVSDLTVCLRLEESIGNRVDAQQEGYATVSIPVANTAASSITWTVTWTDDSTDARDSRLRLTVVAPSDSNCNATGYSVSSSYGSAEIWIMDNDATEVTLAGSSVRLDPGASREFTVTLSRALVASEALSVPLSFGGTAMPGTDYNATCPAALPAGVTCTSLNSRNAAVNFTGPSATSVTLTLAAASEVRNKTVSIGLKSPDSDSITNLGGGVSISDQLGDFVVGGNSVVTLEALRAAVTEAAHGARFRLVRAPNTGSHEVRAVVIISEDQTAGGDFVAASSEGFRTITLLDNRDSIDFAVPLQNDDISEPDGSVTATLDPYSGTAYSIGNPASATVEVLDDDAVPMGCTTVSAELVATVRSYYALNRNRADRGGGENWRRVLIAFGAETSTTLAPYTAAEARKSEAIWSGWRPIREELERLEACGAAAAMSPPLLVVTVTGGGAVTEGADAVFTVRRTGDSAASLMVLLTVAEDTAEGQDFVNSGEEGSKEAVIAAGQTEITYTVPTANDITDEPDGMVTLTLREDAAYKRGEPYAGTVGVTDDDVTPVICAATSAEMVAKVRSYHALNRNRADRGYGENWFRVLIAFGAETHATLAPYTAAEARSGETIWSGWRPIREELERLEACGAATAMSPPLSVVTVTGGGAVTEGAGAVFTVRRTGDTTASLTVLLTVAEDTAGGQDFVDPGEEGSKEVTLETGQAEVTYAVRTADDSTDEPDGMVTLTLREDSRYINGSLSKASVKVLDSSRPMLSIADAQGPEGKSMLFTITLSAPSKERVCFDARTRPSTPVSATEYVDFASNVWNRSRFRPCIQPGQTTTKLGIYIFEDAHDDSGETFEMLIHNAEGATIADAVGVGTIINDDPLPGAYLSRLGRTVGRQIMDAVSDRVTAAQSAAQASREPGLEITLGGEVLPRINFAKQAPQSAQGSLAKKAVSTVTLSAAEYSDATLANRHGTRASEAGFLRTLTKEEVLRGTSFMANLSEDGSGSLLALWGRAVYGQFEGVQDGPGTPITVDGKVATGMLSVDYTRERLSFGAILTQSAGDGDYAETGDGSSASGTVKSRLTALAPWVSFAVTEHAKTWMALGHGSGKMTLTPESGIAVAADIGWRMAAAGVRSSLILTEPGFMLDMVSNAMWVQTSSDAAQGLAASSSEVSQLRFGLEAASERVLASGSMLTPRLEMGLRYDGGDAETGFGLEIGGKLDWIDSTRGLSLGLEGRTLALHEDGDFHDWGLSAAFAYDSHSETKRGFSAAVTRQLGGVSSGGVDALLNPERFPAITDSRENRTADGAWSLELAYGLSRDWGMVGSPYTRVSGDRSAEAARLGYRIEADAAHAADMSVDFWVEPRIRTGAVSVVGLSLEWRW